MGRKLKDMAGERVGALTVVESAGSAPGRHMWRCKCDCGSEVLVSGAHLRMRGKLSCGCMNSANRRAASRTHGYTAGGKTKAYHRWAAMRQRCSNPNNKQWKDYGGRGIKICERWADFEAYYADVGDPPVPGLTLDRKDNDGDYEPGNVRWATHFQQRENTRPEHKSRKLTADDVRFIRESSATNVRLAEMLGVTDGNISAIRLGLTWRNVT